MKTKLFTLLFAVLTLFSVAQPPAKIWYDETNLRTSAIRHFAHGRFLDCLMNCQRLNALGESDGLVAGLMAMAYDSLMNNEAATGSRELASKFRVDSSIYARLAAANLSPDIYKRSVMQSGASFYNSARFDSSEAYFSEYVKMSPNDTFALFFLANSQFYQGKYNQAVVTYKHLLELDFNRSDVHNLTGVCYLLQNNYLSARDYFSQAVLLEKNYGLAHYNLGRVHYGLNDKVAAIQSLNDAYVLMPKDSNCVALLSQIYLEQQDWKNAEKYLAKLYSLNRNNLKVGWNLVDIAWKNKDYEHAAAYLQNIARVSPKSIDAYNKLGEAYILTGNYEQAFNSYENAIQKAGENRDFHYGAGMCANRIGLYGKATEHLAKAIEFDASHAASHKEMGDAYMGLGKKKNAKKSYKTATALGWQKEKEKTQEQSTATSPLQAKK